MPMDYGFSLRNMYPNMFVTPSSTEQTIPEEDERQAMPESDKLAPNPVAVAKAPSIFIALGGFILFIIVSSIVK